MIKVAINGFGRIGRLVARIILDNPSFELVAINDLTDAEQLAYLLKYDTSHRTFMKDKIRNDGDNIIIDDVSVKVFSEKDPSNLPWKDLNIDLVFECTGLFTKKEDAYKHIEAGSKKVIISAPAKGDVKTIVYNVNNNILDGSEEIISAASCTTNCLAPVLRVVDYYLKIKKGYMTTVHAYTNDQANLDVAHKKGINSRRGRASAANIVPASTGAASAIGLVLPNLKGKLDGMAMRVPVTTGSVIDLTLEVEKETTAEYINSCFKANINETLDFTMDPIVSSDVIGESHSAIVDGLSTKVLKVDDISSGNVSNVNKQLIKIVAWYDNEYSYSMQMVRTALDLMEKARKKDA